jgi:hypothetical protein
MVLSTLHPVALEMAEVSAEDELLPDDIDKLNLVLNRARLAAFLSEFAADKDVRDLLTLDVLGTAAGVPFTSTGVVEPAAALALRPFRIWEYAWLYKALGLSPGWHRRAGPGRAGDAYLSSGRPCRLPRHQSGY